MIETISHRLRTTVVNAALTGSLLVTGATLGAQAAKSYAPECCGCLDCDVTIPGAPCYCHANYNGILCDDCCTGTVCC